MLEISPSLFIRNVTTEDACVSGYWHDVQRIQSFEETWKVQVPSLCCDLIYGQHVDIHNGQHVEYNSYFYSQCFSRRDYGSK
jgi:hypothetical protein